MIVQVRLHAALAHRYGGGQSKLAVELPAGGSVGDLLATLGVPAERHIIVGRNGQLAQRSTTLTDGDTLELMSQMQGGT